MRAHEQRIIPTFPYFQAGTQIRVYTKIQEIGNGYFDTITYSQSYALLDQRVDNAIKITQKIGGRMLQLPPFNSSWFALASETQVGLLWLLKLKLVCFGFLTRMQFLLRVFMNWKAS
jgi:hypothetical protein